MQRAQRRFSVCWVQYLAHRKLNIMLRYKIYIYKTITLVSLSMLIIMNVQKEEKATFAGICTINYKN